MTHERAAQALVFSPDSGILRVHTVTVRPAAAGEVRVRVAASGVCHSDLHVLNGDWKCRDQLVLGHEADGIVESVGDDIEQVSAGDRVILSGFPPCGVCVARARETPWLCAGSKSSEHRLANGGSAFDVDGQAIYPFLGIGGFSEYVVVSENAGITVPDALPHAISALNGPCAATGVGGRAQYRSCPARRHSIGHRLRGKIRHGHLTGNRIRLDDVNDAFESMHAGRDARAMVAFT